MGGWGQINPFAERIEKPVRKIGPPLTFICLFHFFIQLFLSSCRLRHVSLKIDLFVAGHGSHGGTSFCDMGYCNQPNAYSCDRVANTQRCLCNPGFSGIYCENQQCKDKNTLDNFLNECQRSLKMRACKFLAILCKCLN